VSTGISIPGSSIIHATAAIFFEAVSPKGTATFEVTRRGRHPESRKQCPEAISQTDILIITNCVILSEMLLSLMLRDAETIGTRLSPRNAGI
jgi:hypothetical protein